MTRARRRPLITVHTSRGTYEIRGAPEGPANARSLRLHGGRWRKGTAEEWRAIVRAIVAEVA